MIKDLLRRFKLKINQEKRSESTVRQKPKSNKSDVIDVSIIVPVFNVETYIGKCLESLINQTNKNIEIIIIDDASTDQSINVIKKYQEKDNRIRLVQFNNNQGVAAARNFGISLARGTYIGFVDPDDYVSTDYFGHLSKTGRLSNADIVVCSRIQKIDNNGKPEGFKKIGIDDNCNFVKLRDRLRIIRTTGVTWNKIYKTSLIKEKQILFPEIKTMGTDNYFTFFSLKTAKVVVCTNKVTYFYRTNPNSIIRKKKDETYYKQIDVYDRIRKRLDFDNTDKYARLWGEILKERLIKDALSNLIGFDDDGLKKGFEVYFQKIFPEMSLNPGRKIVVSLTSYPARINNVVQTIRSIKKQTIQPYKIILWLAKEQFPNKVVPESLEKEIDDIFQIKWCDQDIRSYKKLIPALNQFKEELIITADDDVEYPNDWIFRLLASYLTDPKSIHCLRCRKIVVSDGKINSYKTWKLEKSSIGNSYSLLPTGVGGVLYDATFFDSEIANADLFTDIAKDADDLWFWTMTILGGHKIRCAYPPLIKPNIIVGTQSTALWNSNKTENDLTIQRILNRYPKVMDILNVSEEN